MYLLDERGIDMKNYLHNPCPCGKNHSVAIDEVVVGSGVVERLPEFVKKYGKKPFVVADVNTYQAAGEKACDLLNAANIPFGSFDFADYQCGREQCTAGRAMFAPTLYI